ncbi:MAG TPA: DNA recombination protein RmuC [Jatrophihabitantaceae bacterium]|nr:DNA recombination protein RmuC [Jatrophihabitantaceae bacterium]
MTLLIALLALIAGLAVGWLAARSRAESELRAARDETASVRAAAAVEHAATAKREELLMGHGNLAALVAPLRDSLGRVQQQLDEVQRGRASSDAALREQVFAMSRTSEQLRSETAALVTALRAPHVRGRWGEMQLERVVEAAGMTEHVDFTAQLSVTGSDGTRQRPDLVVHLAGGKQVVVDAKAPLAGYLAAAEAGNEAERDDRLAAHARHLRTHIDQLSGKEYWQRFTPTPEFVVCFVPADAILDAALRTDPALLEHAFERNVVLATPSTLVALLRTVAYTWRQEALAENAERVHRLGRELYQRLGKVGEHVDALGRSLGKAVGAYNDAVGSLERRVLPKAREMSALGVVPPGTEIPELQPLTEATPRLVTAEELLTLDSDGQMQRQLRIGG